LATPVQKEKKEKSSKVANEQGKVQQGNSIIVIVRKQAFFTYGQYCRLK
jgi:hypothetical protein